MAKEEFSLVDLIIIAAEAITEASLSLDAASEREAAKSTAAKPAAQAATKPATKPAAATEKPAAAATKPAAKPATQAATKPAAAAAKSAVPKPVGKYDIEVTRAIIRQVGNTDGLGQQTSRDILDEEAGVKAISQAKPTDLDKIYEACVVALASVGAQPEGDAVPKGAAAPAAAAEVTEELEDPTA